MRLLTLSNITLNWIIKKRGKIWEEPLFNLKFLAKNLCAITTWGLISSWEAIFPFVEKSPQKIDKFVFLCIIKYSSFIN